MTSYAELAVTSNFSFLRGASHPDELVYQAVTYELAAISIADRNTLAGVVRAHKVAKEVGLKLLVGTRLVTVDGFEVIAYPVDRQAYGRLCRLLTLGNRRAPKGECFLSLPDIIEYGDGQVFIIMPPRKLDKGFEETCTQLTEAFPETAYLGASFLYQGGAETWLQNLADLSDRLSVPLVAINDVMYHCAERRVLQDVVTCIREHCTIEEAGFLLQANAERHIKPPKEMARLFRRYPEAIARTLEIADQVTFSLDELRYEYPDEVKGKSTTPQEELERLTWIGADERYPDGIPEKVTQAIHHELKLIAAKSYAPYFLTVHDVVQYAERENILCQGRGSAANSVVCYCLGITAVDPTHVDLLFERFISMERNEPPDIDVDFEHERREEVIQYVYRKYGRDRAGIAATVITYRARSAIREVGKVMGLSEDVIAALAGTVWGWSAEGIKAEHIEELGLDPFDKTIFMATELARDIIGFPRHLSQHVGGFVMTRGPLCEVIPIANAAMDDRTIVEWDKDDLDALGMLKVDVLALGMLSCIAKAFDLIHEKYGIRYSLASVPQDDPAVYDMLCKADSVGVFQVESRAQMSMLPRLKPRTYYDLVIEVAIVRPGPIQGNMVHPYLRRRDGLEPVDFPSEELREVLGKTMGVPLFQEQAMRIAIVGAGFSPSEADKLRRAMATFRKTGTIHQFRDKFIKGMTARGYEEEFAERCFKQIEGFGDYGFPESHAASFALLVYISSWIKWYYPDVFLCTILNSQPMGFYAPAQLVRDAREHDVKVLPPDINASNWDCTLEPLEAEDPRPNRTEYAVRLGLRQIKGLARDYADRVMEVRGRGFDSVRDVWIRTGFGPAVLERLANADTFPSLGLNRRDAAWAVRGLSAGVLPLFVAAQETELQKEAPVALPPMLLGEHVVHDYATLRLSLKAHPMSFFRDAFDRDGVIANERLSHIKPETRVSLAGLVLVRQRPGSAKGVIFATLEDETGVANIIVWPKTFEKYRKIVLGARVLGVRGRVQREGLVIHVVADHLIDMSDKLALLSDTHGDIKDTLARADEVKRPGEDPREITFRRNEGRQQRAAKILPRSRDFH